MDPLTNDTLTLVPQTTFGEPLLTFDFPALEIGVAEYAEGPTGCTVFHFPRGAYAYTDIRGGAPGILLAREYGWIHALCLAGGSLYGLEAATGVSAELFARRGYATGWRDIVVVSGAILFDYGPRGNAIYPDKALGRAALRAATAGRFPLGAHGAGATATVGKSFGFEGRESAGQGGAFRQVGPTRLAVFSVVNAVGALVDRAGQVVRGYRDPQTGQRRSLDAGLTARLAQPGDPAGPGNTTLTVVVINQRMDQRGLRQLARQVHTSMARAIQPFHTPADGDILYAVTTEEVDNPALDPLTLGLLASELAWDAVLCCF